MGLISRFIASFDAIKPVPDLVKLDNEFNQITGANGILNGGSTSNRQLTKYNHATEPVLELDQLGAGTIVLLKQNGVTKLTITNGGLLNPTSSSVNTGFNADQVDGIEGANIALLNTHRSYFSVTLGFEPDPTVTTTNTEDRQVWIAPDNIVEMKINRLWVHFNAGSHTAGGSLVYTVRKRNFTGGAQSDLGNVTLDNTNNTSRTVYYNDIADFTLTAGDQITFYKNPATAGTNSERSVSIGMVGFQRLST